MSPASTLAALVASACAALEALADADAAIVRTCARGGLAAGNGHARGDVLFALYGLAGSGHF